MRRNSQQGVAGRLLPALCFFLAGAAATAQQRAAPVSLDQLLEKAKLAQSSSRFADAAGLYARATRLEPGIAELWANRGLMEHLAAQPEAALASFAHALTLKPALFTPLLFSAEDEVALKRPSRALPLLDRAANVQPGNPDVAIARAKAYTALGSPGQAAAAYQTATDLRPDKAPAWYGLAVASLDEIESRGSVLAREHASSPWSGVLYAEDLLAQGRLSEGTKLYREAIAKADAPARCKLRQELTVSEENQLSALNAETKAALQEAAAAPSGTAPCTCEGKTPACAYLAGRYAESADMTATDSNQQAADPEALFWSIKANERRAVVALARFEELSPQSPATFDLTGDLYRRQSAPERARAEYARALSLDPHDPAALLGTAAAFLAESHPDQALEFARRGLADRPADPKLNVAVAEALMAKHLYDEALPYAQTSLRTPDKSDAFAHGLLGRIAADKGDTATAIRELRLGLPADRDGSLHFQLARALRKTGDVEGAKAAENESRALVALRLTAAETALQSASETNPN